MTHKVCDLCGAPVPRLLGSAVEFRRVSYGQFDYDLCKECTEEFIHFLTKPRASHVDREGCRV